MNQDNSSAQKDIEPFAAYVKKRGIDIRSKNALLRAVDSFYYEQKSYRNSMPLKNMVSDLYDTDSFANLMKSNAFSTVKPSTGTAGMDYQSAVAALGTFPKDRVPRLNDLIQPAKKATTPNYFEELTVKNKAISDAADQTAKALVAKIRNGEFTSAMLESLKNPVIKTKVDALLGRTIGNAQGTTKADTVKSSQLPLTKFNDMHTDLASHTNKASDLGTTGLKAVASTPAPKLTSQADLYKSLSDTSLDGQKNGEGNSLQQPVSSDSSEENGTTGTFIPESVEEVGGGRIQDKDELAPENTAYIDSYKGRYKKRKIDYRALEALKAMQNAVKAAGLDPNMLLPYGPRSAFRSADEQEALRQGKRVDLKKMHPDWTKEQIEKVVNKSYAVKTAHMSGRAIDFQLDPKNLLKALNIENVEYLRKTKLFIWLTENAEKFGFYPLPSEPWHWEYNPPVNK